MIVRLAALARQEIPESVLQLGLGGGVHHHLHVVLKPLERAPDLLDVGLDARQIVPVLVLGDASGAVTVCEPALSRQLTYDYRYEQGTRRARLQLQSNAPGVGRLSLRVPDGAAVVALSVDGSPVAFVRLSTTWASHQIELRLR